MSDTPTRRARSLHGGETRTNRASAGGNTASPKTSTAAPDATIGSRGGTCGPARRTTRLHEQALRPWTCQAVVGQGLRNRAQKVRALARSGRAESRESRATDVRGGAANPGATHAPALGSAGAMRTAPVRRIRENRRLTCAVCGGSCERRSYRGGRPHRYCSPRCQRLGWCREQLEAAGFTVSRVDVFDPDAGQTEAVLRALRP